MDDPHFYFYVQTVDWMTRWLQDPVNSLVIFLMVV